MVESLIKMLAAIIGKVVLAGWDLRWELLWFAVIPCTIREVVLFVEGTGLVISELVISHNKFIVMR